MGQNYKFFVAPIHQKLILPAHVKSLALTINFMLFTQVKFPFLSRQ